MENYTRDEMREIRATAKANRNKALLDQQKTFEGFCKMHGWCVVYVTSQVCIDCSRLRAYERTAGRKEKELDPDEALGGDPEDLVVKARRYAAILRPSGELRWYYSQSAAEKRGRKEWKKLHGKMPS